MRNHKRNIICLMWTTVLLTASNFSGFSQEHFIQRPENKWMQLAEEQYNQELFRLSEVSAQHFLHERQYLPLPAPEEQIERARYLKTLTALKINEPSAADSALLFLSQTINPSYSQRVSLLLGHYYFRNEALNAAIPFYESAQLENLSNEEIADSRFELAYAYFNSRQFDKAEPLFASIREVPGKYYLAGNYYYGLLAYNEGKYEEALKSFEKIDNEKQYRNIVPYYIAEIYYFMGNRQKALDKALKLIRRPEKLFYDNELYLLAAQVLFEEKRYGDALPYFEHFYDNVDEIRKEELYEMGYSYYKVEEWEHAIEKFKPLSAANDSLGQTAMYLLGDCYLKTGDKKSARNAFGICADMPFNKKQKEAAMLLYAKLSYEMGYTDIAIKNLTSLINDFPNSSNRSESKTLLSDLLMKTNRFSDAFAALQDVSAPGNDYWKVRQKVTYGYAMQQLQRNNSSYADSLLMLSLQHPVNSAYESAALFWRGEIADRQNRAADALFFLQTFIRKNEVAPASSVSPNATTANAYLNMGYAAMRLKNYATAKEYFEKARILADNSSFAGNTFAREGDAAFMQRNYREALSLYDKVIAAGAPEADYAQLQKARILGVQDKPSEKIALLQSLIARTSYSAYANEARYELASTYLEEEKYALAITTLEPLTQNTDARAFASKAWSRIAFAYQSLGQTKKAIETYRKVISDFPASDERQGALDALRSLYIETNQPEAYSQLLQQFNLPDADSEALDSTYYASAEAQIASGKWKEAKAALETYLQKFPNGAFTTRAHYYKAESHYELKEYPETLEEYNKILALPWNEFSELSAKRAAEIAFRKEDYAKAIHYYGLLRNNAIREENLQLAYSGLMRAAYADQKFDEASRYADTLLTIPGLSQTNMQEVRLLKARSLQRSGKLDEALAIYETLKTADAEAAGAEARFNIAQILFDQKKLKEAEAAAADAIKLNAASEYWTVKSYLLIADILTAQKDYFNAKATLQSILKNAQSADLKKQAQTRLEEVKKREKQTIKLRQN